MLNLDPSTRKLLWSQLVREIETYFTDSAQLPVTPQLDPKGLRNELSRFDFSQPLEPAAALKIATIGLTRHQVHTPHPRYWGLFNPAPTAMGVAGDALVATFNPQLAAWSHSPWAAEVERHLVQAFGERFGYAASDIDGTFCSGGMEANHTAVLCALTNAFPEYVTHGVRALRAQPVFYVSSESHHSFLKAARMCGIGAESVRHVGVDGEFRMRPDLLRQAIANDRRSGFLPFMVVATAGTTNAGAVDPLVEIAEVAEAEQLWFHVDAAWGGAAAFVPELRPLLEGIERAQSITFDAHKWLSVPMGAGVFITRDRNILEQTFQVATAYMPKEAAGMDITDPHLHSMQWSRRFIGLKVFLSLLVAGWEGYEETIRHQTAMGALMRERLAAAGWEIVNRTPLPVVCFAERNASAERQKEIAMRVVASGEAWISTTLIGGERTVVRACVTNYRSQPEDVEALVASLDRASKLDVAQP